MYAITMTYPDFRYALFIINWWYANLDSTHVAVIVQILRYMQGILHYSLTYIKNQLKFMSYINANWSGTIDR